VVSSQISGSSFNDGKGSSRCSGLEAYGSAASFNILRRKTFWSLSARKRTRYAHCEFWRSWVLTRMYGPGRASQEVFVDLSAVRSCINVFGLSLERDVLLSVRGRRSKA
jgi:hypothetical protein